MGEMTLVDWLWLAAWAGIIVGIFMFITELPPDVDFNDFDDV